MDDCLADIYHRVYVEFRHTLAQINRFVTRKVRLVDTPVRWIGILVHVLMAMSIIGVFGTLTAGVAFLAGLGMFVYVMHVAIATLAIATIRGNVAFYSDFVFDQNKLKLVVLTLRGPFTVPSRERCDKMNDAIARTLLARVEQALTLDDLEPFVFELNRHFVLNWSRQFLLTHNVT